MSAETYPAPRLLMISGHVPQAGGADERARAWRLLLHGAEVCETWLLAAKDGPVNLGDWRTLSARTHRLSLVTGSFTARRHSLLAGNVAAWTRETSFDAVVCTDPRLWTLAQSVPATVRVCDTAVAARRKAGRLIEPAGADLILRATDDEQALSGVLQRLLGGDTNDAGNGPAKRRRWAA